MIYVFIILAIVLLIPYLVDSYRYREWYVSVHGGKQTLIKEIEFLVKELDSVQSDVTVSDWGWIRVKRSVVTIQAILYCDDKLAFFIPGKLSTITLARLKNSLMVLEVMDVVELDHNDISLITTELSSVVSELKGRRS